MYIIRNSNGAYVNQPGSRSSFTSNPLRARRFATFEAAKAECCGNEHPVSLWDIVEAGR
jgi:hypothetical protein